MAGCVESEGLRQGALYAGMDSNELYGGMLLQEDLGLGPLTVLMLLITLGESLGKDALALSFNLGSLNTVDDLVDLFCPAAACSAPRVSYCLH